MDHRVRIELDLRHLFLCHPADVNGIRRHKRNKTNERPDYQLHWVVSWNWSCRMLPIKSHILRGNAFPIRFYFEILAFVSDGRVLSNVSIVCLSALFGAFFEKHHHIIENHHLYLSRGAHIRSVAVFHLSYFSGFLTLVQKTESGTKIVIFTFLPPPTLFLDKIRWSHPAR